jgi:hypothetical protein
MNQPQAFVIASTDPSSRHYPISQRNLAQTLSRAKLHGWKLSVWPATEGYMVTDQEWQDIGVRLLDRGAIIHQPGARGCWFSHWRLWQQCIDLDQPIIILEHDAYIRAAWPEDIDLDQCVWKLHLDDGRGLRENNLTGEWSYGAYSYTMTPRFAHDLMVFSRLHGAQAVDKQLGRLVIPWQYWREDLAPHKPRSRKSTTSPKKMP